MAVRITSAFWATAWRRSGSAGSPPLCRWPGRSALLAALVMFPSFDSYADLSELTLFGAFVGFVAAGETLVLLIGGVDLSAPWVMTAGGVLVASWATAQHVPDSWFGHRRVRWWPPAASGPSTG